MRQELECDITLELYRIYIPAKFGLGLHIYDLHTSAAYYERLNTFQGCFYTACLVKYLFET